MRASLGWLIDSEARQVLVFQPKTAILRLDKPPFLLADNLLTGFSLDMQKTVGCWVLDRRLGCPTYSYKEKIFIIVLKRPEYCYNN